MTHRHHEGHAIASQYGLPMMGENAVVHDLMATRPDGNNIATVMLADQLWKKIPDDRPALVVDGQAGHWMMVHPHTLVIENEGVGDIPLSHAPVSGIALITYPLADSKHLSDRFKLIESQLGHEGVLLVLEQVGEERDMDWRESLLRQHKLVQADVYARSGYIVWHAREKKIGHRNPHDYIEKYAHDSEEWRQRYFPIQFARVLTYYHSLGYEVVNFHEIEQRLRNSKMPHMDFESFRQGRGVELLDKRCGACVYHIPIKGEDRFVYRCNNDSAHEIILTQNDLWHDISLHERVSHLNKMRQLHEKPLQESILQSQCLDCFDGIRQTAEEIGHSPVGDLYYVHRYCMGGHIEEESIGFVLE